MGYLLSFVALILLVIFTPIGLLYSAIKYAIYNTLQEWYALIDKYSYGIAISLDQLGNVIFQVLFNDIFILPDSPNKFGDEDETVSYVLSLNYFANTLKPLGKGLVAILEWLDKGHMEKSRK